MTLLIGAINDNNVVNEAVDNVKDVNASKATKAINISTAVKAIKNPKGDINRYAIALIHSLNEHEDAMDASITAENTKKATPLQVLNLQHFPSNSQ
jgi:hypothetical protein